MAQRIVGYIRVSGDSQHGNEQDGAPRQKRAIETWAKKSKKSVTEWIEDLGVSGTLELAQRPGLSRLLDSLHPPGILVVEKCDRLARALIEGELIIRAFQQSGWQVVSAETGEDLAKAVLPMAIFMRQLQGAHAEFDKRNIVARLRTAREQKRNATGRCEGRKPFADAKTLNRIKVLSRKRDGKKPTLQAIADALNSEGIPTASGKIWTRGLIHHFAR
jgi:DNA invertase Pin-like site-specific DNA recombinase